MAIERSRLYTRTGDDGTSGLFSGDRVPKDHPRLEAYGLVDELNSFVGSARAEVLALRSGGCATGAAGERAAVDLDALSMIDRILEALQRRLFELGADLATPPGSRFESRVSRLGDADVQESERWIDEADADNEPLRSFVLPGGSELAARLHVARTAARRAERAIVAASRSETIGEAALRFVNRTSDLLFALARRANGALGVPDVPWAPRSKPS